MENATHCNAMVPLIVFQQQRLIINVFQEQKLFIAKEIKKLEVLKYSKNIKTTAIFK
jgi:hypothetical protein